MTKTNRLSTGIATLALLCGMLVLCSGCHTRGPLTAVPGVNLPERADISAQKWLKGIETFRAAALVTHYDENGKPELSRQVIEIDVDSASISASCGLPAGSWWARNALGPVYNPMSWGVLFRWYMPMVWGDLRGESLSTLDLILHRVRGPLGLCDGREEVVAVDEVFAAGFSTWRMSSDGSSMASAYFFDKATGALRMVSRGGIQATDNGTVTVYRLGYAENGAMIPVGFEVMEIGDNSIIGSRMLVSVSFENIVTE